MLTYFTILHMCIPNLVLTFGFIDSIVTCVTIDGVWIGEWIYCTRIHKTR
jgi:hypothetical protein